MSKARKRLRTAFYLFAVCLSVALFYFVRTGDSLSTEAENVMLAFSADLMGLVILAIAFTFFMMDETKDIESKLDALIEARSIGSGSLQLYSDQVVSREKLISAIASSDEISLVGYSFANDLQRLSEPLKDFVSRGGKLEVALVDPKSNAGRSMARAVNNARLVSEPIERSKRYLAEIGQSRPGQVSLKLVDWIPSVSIWLFRDQSNDVMVFVGLNGLNIKKGKERRIYSWIDPKLDPDLTLFFSAQVKDFENSHPMKTVSLNE